MAEAFNFMNTGSNLASEILPSTVDGYRKNFIETLVLALIGQYLYYLLPKKPWKKSPYRKLTPILIRVTLSGVNFLRLIFTSLIKWRQTRLVLWHREKFIKNHDYIQENNTEQGLISNNLNL